MKVICADDILDLGLDRDNGQYCLQVWQGLAARYAVLQQLALCMFVDADFDGMTSLGQISDKHYTVWIEEKSNGIWNIHRGHSLCGCSRYKT